MGLCQPVGWAGMSQGPRKPMGFVVARGARGHSPDSKFLPQIGKKK